MKKVAPEEQSPTYNNNNGNILPKDVVTKDAPHRIPDESRVGKKLSDLTTRRVIILVLTMLFSVPLFSTNTYLFD